MRSDVVVVDAPFLDDVSGMPEAHEPVGIEALVPQPAVEALDIGILDRLPGPDEIELHPFR